MNQLLEVDKEFSQLSKSNGIAHAFDYYMANSATILKDGMLPVVGRKAINEVFEKMPKEASLLWEPDFADIAESGEMGYTIGHWVYSVPDSAGEVQTAKGNYITIWKKQADGNWKYVFDTGTDGPAED